MFRGSVVGGVGGRSGHSIGGLIVVSPYPRAGCSDWSVQFTHWLSPNTTDARRGDMARRGLVTLSLAQARLLKKD
jgi:hypothetical protein